MDHADGNRETGDGRSLPMRTWPDGYRFLTVGYKEVMYIGIGTVVLILVILLIVALARRV
jgi:hypothetical protein